MKIISNIYILIPILSLVITSITLLVFGVDIPFQDDWRPYIYGTAGSLKLDYLFAPANDTLYPLGKLLDSLADRYLNGNNIAYQFISMSSVLGSLLYLQWKLLSLALKNRLMVASAFSLTILMLQPNTYWGWQTIAYQQALPLVFILTSLYMVLNTKINIKLIIPILFFLGLLSGFSYISGAFTILILGILIFILSYLDNTATKKRYKLSGISLMLSGIITSGAQLWVIAIVQRGVHTHTAMALPTDSDFWLFMLGKIARSLMLPSGKPILSLLAISIVLIMIFYFITWSLKLLTHRRSLKTYEAKATFIFVSLFIVIFTYLGLISAGRTNLHGPEINTSLDLFSFAFQRFHFFWVTLLWPWVLAIFFTILNVKNLRVNYKVAIFLPIVILPLFSLAGVFSYSKYFNMTMDQKLNGLKCMQDKYSNNADMICADLYPAPMDLRESFLHAKNNGTTFTNNIRKSLFVIHDNNIIEDNVIFKNKPSEKLKINKPITLKLLSTYTNDKDRILKSIKIKFGTYQKKNMGKAQLELLGPNKTKYVKEFSLESLKDNQYHSFDLDEGYYSSGKIHSINGEDISTWESYQPNDAKEYTCIIYEYEHNQVRYSPGCGQ